MNLYSRKKSWLLILSLLAAAIVAFFVLYTNIIVNRFAERENQQIKTWADAVQTQAALISYTDEFFGGFEKQEDLRVDLLASAYRRFLAASPEENVSIYLDIISNNISIPVVITDNEGNIIISLNLPENQREKKSFDSEMQTFYSKYDPIKMDNGMWLYYSESLIYTELEGVLKDMFFTFMDDVIYNAVGSPVIITDSTMQKVIAFGNIDSVEMHNPSFVTEQIRKMDEDNLPIKVAYLDKGHVFIHFRTSDLLVNVRFYGYLQILLVAVFVIVAYLFLSGVRRSEQNQVWAGMAKETAHQLGTPLTSLMGWIELMKAEEHPFIGTAEMENDVNRLTMIAERFSKIGSVPTLEDNDAVKAVSETMNYLKKRFSSGKIDFDIQLPDRSLVIPLNKALFSWVLENLTKNAIDAMPEGGRITIEMTEGDNFVIVDVSDNGKGIHRNMFKQIFKPGYTTKKRGWGLGLSLVKRIIEVYHKGKIFVKSSTIGRGTTFRIMLKK